jgi:hypothetical protein
MNLDLSGLWDAFEAEFSLSGPRRAVREVLGSEVGEALEALRLLVTGRASDRYPCPSPGGEGCPRVVIRPEGQGIVAMCGMTPPECPDLELAPEDVQIVALVPESLAEAVGRALQVRTKVEALPYLRGAYRVGTFIPEPGVRQAIYLLVRTSEPEYAEAVDALRVHSAGQPFAILIPTNRFVSDELRRQASTVGIPLVFLSETLELDPQQGLRPLGDPLSVFAYVSRPATLNEAPVHVVAQAFVKPRGQGGSWRSLDDAAYTSLLSASDSYDVFADERTSIVSRADGKGRHTVKGVPASHFKQIRSAIEARGFYDPVQPDDAPDSAKQIFQRARQSFDLKPGKTWLIFKTRKLESHAVYRFEPDSSVSFAFVFLPKI